MGGEVGMVLACCNKKTKKIWHHPRFSVSAARQLQPIWSQTQIKVLRFEDAYERAKDRFNTILSKIGLTLPQEVQL